MNNIFISKLALSLTPNILQELEARRAKLAAQGKDIINLSAGTPDIPAAEHILKAVSAASLDPENYKYTLIVPDEVKEAVSHWYGKRYGVEITPDEFEPLYGSQEGFAHIFHVLCDPGDTIIVGTPGYPAFFFGPRMAGAEVYKIPLLPENGFLIDFEKIPVDVARRARAMVVSYPSNPLGAVADAGFYERLIAYANRYDITIIHDNAYSEIVHDGAPGGSFLAIPGAKDVGIELNSLSKSYCLTGLRISFALGNKELIGAFRKLRSNIDYGLSSLDYIAAVAALTGPQGAIVQNRAAYRERRDAFCSALHEIGWNVPKTPATMFTWFPLPEGVEDSTTFCMELLEKVGVMCVPGSCFGDAGKLWVRFALIRSPEVLREAARRIGMYLESH